MQGGVVGEPHPVQSGFYDVSQVTFLGERPLRIIGDVIDTGWKDEVFFLSFDEDPLLGDPSHERRYVPRRALATRFANDFDLSPFYAAARQYQVLSTIKDATVDGAYDRVLVDTGLLIAAKTGEQVLFTIDEEIPLNILATRDPEQIERLVRNADLLRSSSERV